MLIIETNLSYENNELIDHQSRIINIDSWNDYVADIENGISKCYNGTMIGNNIPKQSKIENLKYDNFHLSCDIYNYKNLHTKKLVYLIQGNFELMYNSLK